MEKQSPQRFKQPFYFSLYFTLSIFIYLLSHVVNSVKLAKERKQVNKKGIEMGICIWLDLDYLKMRT
jgi:hypothetical protein